MSQKALSEYFTGIVAKRLSEVEVNGEKSNQHEFNGPTSFKKLFGSEKWIYNTRFLYLSEHEDSTIEDSGTLTWYDSRLNKAHRSAEFRFYYSKNLVTPMANPDDLLLVAKTPESKLLTIVAAKGSTSEQQLLWLFGLEEVGKSFLIKDMAPVKKEVGFAGRIVLASLGIEADHPEPEFLDIIIKKFGETFPSTKEFSNFSRSTLKDIDALSDPDKTLLAWMEREEFLFKTLERHLVSKKLKSGFEDNVDDFISFSLSVQNRRKSRAGYAFEHHLSALFDLNGLLYERGVKTERNNVPDFLFPGSTQYYNVNYNSKLLTMLGVKTTAKDRWRQILSEADRIKRKHLVTLEPAISKNQTDEMIAQHVQLVLPLSIRDTYSQDQQRNIVSLCDFISETRVKQKNNL